MGWRRDSECPEPPNTVPSPPETPTTEHSEPTSLPHPAAVRLPTLSPLRRGLAFPRCLAGPGGRRVSHRPVPESGAGLGYTDSAERNAITAGAEGGFKGL